MEIIHPNTCEIKIFSCCTISNIENIYKFEVNTKKIDSINNFSIFKIKVLFDGIISFNIGHDVEFNKIIDSVYNSELYIIHKKQNLSIKTIKIERIHNIKIKVDFGDELEFEIVSGCLNSIYQIYLNNIIKINDDSKELESINKVNKINNIVIIQDAIISSIGNFFKMIFESKGYEVEIKNELYIDDCLNSNLNTMFIILINHSTHNLLPVKFIFYQIEQKNSHFLTDQYLLSKLAYSFKHATQVWEYSTVPSKSYSKFCSNKLKWIPMPFFYLPRMAKYVNKFDECKYDLFFFGHKNKRRENILNELSKHFKIKIGWRCFENDKNKYISMSKIILNIHYYKETGLETCRINEILNYSKLIISEKSPLDIQNTEVYSNIVIFVDEINDDLSNINLMIEKIRHYLNKSKYEKKISKVNNKIHELSDKINKIIDI